MCYLEVQGGLQASEGVLLGRAKRQRGSRRSQCCILGVCRLLLQGFLRAACGTAWPRLRSRCEGPDRNLFFSSRDQGAERGVLGRGEPYSVRRLSASLHGRVGPGQGPRGWPETGDPGAAAAAEAEVSSTAARCPVQPALKGPMFQRLPTSLPMPACSNLTATGEAATSSVCTLQVRKCSRREAG